MSVKHSIGKRLFSFSDNGLRDPVSRITLMVDDDNAVTAGDDTGLELLANCPYADETLAQELLNQVKGYQYRAFEAQSADLDPAAELGDGITADGVYSILAGLTDKGDGYPDIFAPGDREEEDEYPDGGPLTRLFNRQLAQTRSEISKNSKEIALRITQGEARTLINTTLSSISLKIKAANGTETSINLSSGGTIDLTGLVSFTDLKSNTETVINGDYITTGTIKAKRLKLYGKLKVYEDEDSNTVGGYLGYCEGWNPYTKEEIEGGEVNPNIGIGVMNDDDTGQCICTDTFARLSYGNYSAVLVEEGYLQLNGYGAIYFGLPEGGLTVDGQPMEFTDYAVLDDFAFYCNKDRLLRLGKASRSWDVLYAGSCSCCDSDLNKKNSIEALPDKYLAMFDDLEPVRFKLNKGRSGRFHVGYIAQKVKVAMDAAGIDSNEFGGWVMDTDEDGNEIYMLRYEEFGAIYAAKIKQLEARLAKLEETT